MWTRRSFLRTTGVVGSSALAWTRVPALEAVLHASQAVAGQSPGDAATNESYWGQIQRAFALDRTLINLNTGHHCSQPTVVLDAVKRYLDMENLAPVYYAGLINRNQETVRRELAMEFGCDTEEMAITRNASESLQILQNGLDLSAGDEVITTEQDYPRMLTTWDQRMRRDKIKVTRLQFPVPTTADVLYGLFEKALTPRTKVLHFCHITNLTGQLFPVQRICRMARARGITTIVDGAHAGAQFPFKLHDLECDAYGVSLHKWLLAPFGTGILFVRRNEIAKFWPLQAAPAKSDTDIRKFEEIGTAPAAPRIKMYSSLQPGETWGLATVGIEGMEASAISSFLWDKYRIIVAALARSEMPGQQFDYQGVRVTPNVYTTIDEVDTFARAMEELARMPAGKIPAPTAPPPGNEL